MATEAILLDSARLEAWRSFTQASSAVFRALDREMQEELGLPLTWFEVLAKLSRSPDGRMRMQTLAESVVYSRSGMTRLLDRMAGAGLIVRRPCEHDRRGWYAVITAKGRELAERARPGHLERIDRHFLRHLNADDLAALQRALSKVLSTESPAAAPAQ